MSVERTVDWAQHVQPKREYEVRGALTAARKVAQSVLQTGPDNDRWIRCIVPWRSASSGAQQGKLRLEQEFPALEFRTHKSGQLRYIEMRYPEAQ